MATTASTPFGDLLRYWRQQRGVSQLTLSMTSDVSQRHISFLESGRSQPSRDMVLRLGKMLDVPLRSQNQLLTAAGFAPIFTEQSLETPELAPVRQAIDFMLRQQEPYPAIVMDQYWNQIESNRAAQQVFALLMPVEALSECVDDQGRLNLMKATLHPNGLRPVIRNWTDVATQLIHRIHREALAAGEQSITQTLFDQLMNYPDVADCWQRDSERLHPPLLTVNFATEDYSFNFFTTITTLGTPYDITLQELRIESLFPADERTKHCIESLMQDV
ncbi:MAG: helix-turn-helix transcriptional regulator [Cyanobacteria bacterium J06632_22]